MQKMSKIEKFN